MLDIVSVWQELCTFLTGVCVMTWHWFAYSVAWVTGCVLQFLLSKYTIRARELCETKKNLFLWIQESINKTCESYIILCGMCVACTEWHKYTDRSCAEWLKYTAHSCAEWHKYTDHSCAEWHQYTDHSCAECISFYIQLCSTVISGRIRYLQ